MQTSSVRAIAVQISPIADREAIIFEYLPQVKRVAHRICASLPSSIEVNDLIDDGALGLLDAVDRFDPSRGVTFKTYAEYRIRGTILDNLRSLDWVSRSMRQKSRQFTSARRELEMLHGRTPTEEETANAMSISVEKLHELIEKLSTMKVDSLSNPALSEEKISNQVPLSKSFASPAVQFTNLLKSEIRCLLTATIDKLPDRERTIILLYYYEDLTMAEIGETMALNGSQISQIHTQAMTRLRTELIALRRHE